MKWICSLIYNSPFRFFCFQQRFVSVPTTFRIFWYTYVCVDPNHRLVVVAHIQILLGHQILFMAYFLSSSFLRVFTVHDENI